MRSKKTVLLLTFVLIMALLSSGCLFSTRPVVQSIPDQIGKVGQEFSYQVIAYDSDSGELTFSLTENPEGMQIGSSTGLITWIPEENEIGTSTVEVKVSNGNSFKVKQFKITIEDIYLNSIEVSPATINVGVDNSNTITSVTAHYDNGDSMYLTLADCDYDSDNPNIATVSGGGVITGVSAGSAVITVTYTEGGITKSDTVSVTVKDIYLTSISVLPSSMSMHIGDSETIASITAHYDDETSTAVGLDLSTYNSNHTGIASVNTTGRVTGVSAGSAVITVAYTEGGISKTDTVGVTVSEAPKILTSITVLPSSMSMHIGDSETIASITAHYDDETSTAVGLDLSTYNSNHTGIASVNTTGRVTGVSAGSAVITVAYTEGGISKTDTVGVTVSQAPKVLTSIVVLPPSMSMHIGDSETIASITAHYDDETSTAVGLDLSTYNSNHTGIASVNTTGRVTGVSAGSAEITVTYTEGGITKNDTVSVTVSEIPKVLTSITVLPPTMTIRKGQSQTIDSITAYYNNGDSKELALTDCDYDSNKTNVTAIDGVIRVSPICLATTAIITVNYTEGGVTKEDYVTVTVPGG